MGDSQADGEFPADVREIEDLETLKVIADPYRISIIETMGNDRLTVKQLAARLDESVHKLYYHIRMLEKHGIIVPVETNVVSGIVEKTYAVAARRFELKEGLLSAGADGGEGFLQVAKSILDSTLASLRLALNRGQLDMTEKKRAVINRGVGHLSDAQAEQLAERLEEFTKEIVGDDNGPQPGKKPYGLTIVFHRTAGEEKLSE